MILILHNNIGVIVSFGEQEKQILIALGLHVTMLILLKGVLDARGSKLMPVLGSRLAVQALLLFMAFLVGGHYWLVVVFHPGLLGIAYLISNDHGPFSSQGWFC